MLADDATLSCVYSDQSGVQWDLSAVAQVLRVDRTAKTVAPAIPALPSAMQLAERIKPLHAVRCNTGMIWGVEMLATPDTELFMTAGDDGVVRLWRVHADELQQYGVRRSRGCLTAHRAR